MSGRWWYVEWRCGDRSGPLSGCYRTRAEAEYRLAQIAAEPDAAAGPRKTRLSRLLVAYDDGQEFSVVRV